MNGNELRVRIAAREGRFVKVCCIQSVEEARRAIEAGADALGLVAAMPSGPGPIPDPLISEILSQLPKSICTVLLTSETGVDGILRHLERCPAEVVQVVRDIGSSALQELKDARADVAWMQVVHVDSSAALERAKLVCEIADAILLDSGQPQAKTPTLGGTGQTHDWTISKAIVDAMSIPVVLAGGLRPTNIASALSDVAPAGFDLCSGIRVEGFLDDAKMSAFFDALRGAPASR